MVFVFSLLLIAGIFAGQYLDLISIHGPLSFVTSVCLAFIMMDVGLEFSVEKRTIKSYGWDTLFASAAAILPALLWIGYFLWVVQSDWKPALLAGLSSAPTSAGILFAMLSAAGLGATWVFQKARVLAVLDDLVTVLLLTPLEIIIHGFDWRSIASLALIGLFIFSSFRWQNALRLPHTKVWMLIYATILTAIIFVFRGATHIHLEVLIPAFMFGCVLRLTPDEKPDTSIPTAQFNLDNVVKAAFMLLVGCNFPKITLNAIPWAATAGHVIVLTVLANLGKLFLVFCYKNEATFKERLALGVAMFPRGEVGAAVLLIGVGYGLGGTDNTLAVLSLALNLVLTGAFIWVVIRLLKRV